MADSSSEDVDLLWPNQEKDSSFNLFPSRLNQVEDAFFKDLDTPLAELASKWPAIDKRFALLLMKWNENGHYSLTRYEPLFHLRILPLTMQYMRLLQYRPAPRRPKSIFSSISPDFAQALLLGTSDIDPLCRIIGILQDLESKTALHHALDFLIISAHYKINLFSYCNDSNYAVLLKKHIPLPTMANIILANYTPEAKMQYDGKVPSKLKNSLPAFRLHNEPTITIDYFEDRYKEFMTWKPFYSTLPLKEDRLDFNDICSATSGAYRWNPLHYAVLQTFAHDFSTYFRGDKCRLAANRAATDGNTPLMTLLSTYTQLNGDSPRDIMQVTVFKFTDLLLPLTDDLLAFNVLGKNTLHLALDTRLFLVMDLIYKKLNLSSFEYMDYLHYSVGTQNEPAIAYLLINLPLMKDWHNLISLMEYLLEGIKNRMLLGNKFLSDFIILLKEEPQEDELDLFKAQLLLSLSHNAYIFNRDMVFDKVYRAIKRRDSNILWSIFHYFKHESNSGFEKFYADKGFALIQQARKNANRSAVYIIARHLGLCRAQDEIRAIHLDTLRADEQFTSVYGIEWHLFNRRLQTNIDPGSALMKAGLNEMIKQLSLKSIAYSPILLAIGQGLNPNVIMKDNYIRTIIKWGRYDTLGNLLKAGANPSLNRDGGQTIAALSVGMDPEIAAPKYVELLTYYKANFRINPFNPYTYCKEQNKTSKNGQCDNLFLLAREMHGKQAIFVIEKLVNAGLHNGFIFPSMREESDFVPRMDSEVLKYIIQNDIYEDDILKKGFKSIFDFLNRMHNSVEDREIFFLQHV